MHIFLIELSIIPIKNKIANILLNLSLNYELLLIEIRRVLSLFPKYPKVVKENPKTQIVVII